MGRTIAGVLLAGLWLVGAPAQGQSNRPEWLRRPITRERVEQFFDRALEGRFIASKAHAPREVAVVVWPAKDDELLELLPKYPQWVVEEALLRKTPGVVPVLLKSLERNPKGPGGNIIPTLSKIPGKASLDGLVALLNSNVPERRQRAVIALEESKRLPKTLVPKAADLLERELTADFKLARRLIPTYLRLAPASRTIPMVREIRAKAAGAEKDPNTEEGLFVVWDYGGMRQIRILSDIWLASLGDFAAIPRVRAILTGDREGFLAVGAIQTLAERVGKSERTTLESALTAPSSRTREMATLYLGKFGDKRSVKALRAAAKIPAPDESNGWRDSVRQMMLEVADTIESGRPYTPTFRTGTPVPWWRQ